MGVNEMNFLYLDLRFRHCEGVCQFGSFWSGQIFGLFKSLFQGKDLLTGKCGSGVFPFAIEITTVPS
jgi:hypothetical protein